MIVRKMPIIFWLLIQLGGSIAREQTMRGLIMFSPFGGGDNKRPTEKNAPNDNNFQRYTFPPSPTPTSVPSSISKMRAQTSFIMSPTLMPSSPPSLHASTVPSKHPSQDPSLAPSVLPSFSPTSAPSLLPSSITSSEPSLHPTGEPSRFPSATPSQDPTKVPSTIPSLPPSSHPTHIPSLIPSAMPSDIACTTNSDGIFGSSGSNSGIVALYEYEIEIKSSFNGNVATDIIPAVENAISTSIIPRLFEGCQYERKLTEDMRQLHARRRLEVFGFSSEPLDIPQQTGCEREDTNGNNVCFVIEGGVTIYSNTLNATETMAVLNTLKTTVMDERIFTGVNDGIATISFTEDKFQTRDIENQTVSSFGITEAGSHTISSGESSEDWTNIAFASAAVVFGIACAGSLRHHIKKKKSKGGEESPSFVFDTENEKSGSDSVNSDVEDVWNCVSAFETSMNHEENADNFVGSTLILSGSFNVQ